jgi:hypothetical protein
MSTNSSNAKQPWHSKCAAFSGSRFALFRGVSGAIGVTLDFGPIRSRFATHFLSSATHPSTKIFVIGFNRGAPPRLGMNGQGHKIASRADRRP